MRNQEDVSWCYAHAAADYLQFYNQVPEQISAADIAIYYNRKTLPRILRWLRGSVLSQTGLIRTALFDTSEIGYCPEEYFPSDLWTKRTMSGKDVGRVESVSIGKALLEIATLSDQAQSGFYLRSSDLPFVYEFKGMSYQQFSEVILQNDSGSVFNSLRSIACDSHRKPFPKPISNVEMNFKGAATFTNIDQHLSQHLPVSVDFFYGFLDNRDEYVRSIGELHTALLMGRRLNSENNECQYLIKNSYGPDCSEYDHRHQCEAGYIWVSEQSLAHAMTSYVYISTESSVAQTQDALRSRSPASDY